MSLTSRCRCAKAGVMYAPWSSASCQAKRGVHPDGRRHWWLADVSCEATTRPWQTSLLASNWGDTLRIRRNEYTVVGLTRRMVSSSGDPMVFIPLKDAQEAQFLKDNDAIVQNRARTAANPAFNRPGVPGLLSSINASQTSSSTVNAVLVRLNPRHQS
jgi:hypothetical protein